MEINQFQGITLYAFFEAIAQQTTPLPEDLQQQMSAVADIFSVDTDSAIDRLDAIAKHPRLNPIYEATRQQLQVYEPSEMSSDLYISMKMIVPKGAIDNIQSSLQLGAVEDKSDQESLGWRTKLLAFVKNNSKPN